MPSFADELTNFRFREIKVPLTALFPDANIYRVQQQFLHLRDMNPHKTVFRVARELWNGGYESLLRENGFWDPAYAKFSGHCHQCTPALGMVLKLMGFPVTYLECYRIREHFPQTGIIEQVPPQEEPNPETKEEFCGIGRIPYCCLEIDIAEKKYYLTGKHLRPDGNETKALLTPTCYQKMTGVFPHQDDPAKSGIYLQPVIPARNPHRIDFERQVVWMKQTYKDPAPEYFAPFLRVRLQ